MKKTSRITCAFVDLGAVLLTEGWDHLAQGQQIVDTANSIQRGIIRQLLLWAFQGSLFELPARLLVAIQHNDGPGIDSVTRIWHMRLGS